jgi:oxygen-independent coproporphyrinogen-3 oxidase
MEIDFYEYVTALVAEIKRSEFKGLRIDTIFIGGGTPSILPVESIALVVDTFRGSFSLSTNCEITIESNPGTVTLENLKKYKDFGINRISIGLQCSQNSLLTNIGRIHTMEDFVLSYQYAREAGLDNINVDLIFGIPGQSLDDWKATLNEVTLLKPEHLSCYSLKVEEGTPLYTKVELREAILADELTDREMYHHTISFLKTKGYNHYEISNFAKAGYECRHNLIYWDLQNYIGFGAAAHSHYDGTRWENIKDYREYIKLITHNNSTVINKEILNQRDRISEYIFLGLRKTQGINLNTLKSFFTLEGGEIEELNDKIKILAKRGLLISENNCIRLSPKGLDLANLVFEEFI